VSYELERSADAGGTWEQVYSGANTTYAEDVVSPSPATMISVNFTHDGTGTPDLEPADVAGFLPRANWNNISANNPSVAAGSLIDSDGALVGGISFTGSGWQNTWNAGKVTPDHAMLSDWMEVGGTGPQLTIAGMSATYDLILYLCPFGSNDINVTVNGVTKLVLNRSDMWSVPNLVENDTFVVFSGLSGPAEVSLAQVSGPHRGLSGFQIVLAGSSAGGEGSYRYRVRAVNEVGSSDWRTGTGDCVVQFTPQTPEAITYPSSSTTGIYDVNWAAATGAASYELERSADAGSTWAQVYSGANTTYAETVGDGSYRYRVRAVNASGSSDWRTGAGDCIVSLPVLRTETIVDTYWGNGFVGSNTDLRGTQVGSTGDFNNDGVQDYRRTRAFDETTLLNPDAGVAGKSTTFYGGTQATYFGSTTARTFARFMIRNVAADPVQIATNTSHSGQKGLHGLVVWQAADFLNMAVGETATFDRAANPKFQPL